MIHRIIFYSCYTQCPCIQRVRSESSFCIFQPGAAKRQSLTEETLDRDTCIVLGGDRESILAAICEDVRMKVFGLGHETYRPRNFPQHMKHPQHAHRRSSRFRPAQNTLRNSPHRSERRGTGGDASVDRIFVTVQDTANSPHSLRRRRGTVRSLEDTCVA